MKDFFIWYITDYYKHFTACRDKSLFMGGIEVKV